MSGFSARIFVDTPPPDLICPICLEVLNNPRQCRNGHAFCEGCILGSIRSGNHTCPVGRCPIAEASLSSIRLVKNMIGQMAVCCPTITPRIGSQSTSCEWTGRVVDLQMHSDQCAFRLMMCAHIGCHRMIERRHSLAHSEVCEHKLLPCPLCDNVLKRADAEDHRNLYCPQRRTRCPNSCGVSVPFIAVKAHLKKCPKQEINCTNFSSWGCSASCRIRFLRKDLVLHLKDPMTTAAVISHLSSGIECRDKNIEHLTEINSRLRDDYTLLQHDYILLEHYNLLTNFTRHHSCEESKSIPAQQLSQDKVMDGQVWSIHHIAHEFCSADFAEGDATFEISSPMVDLCEGVQVILQLDRSKSGGSVTGYIRLFGFRGKAEFIMTAFRFGKGAPQKGSKNSGNCTTDDCYWGCGVSFTQTQLLEEGWLTPDNKIRLLLKVNLRCNAVLMA